MDLARRFIKEPDVQDPRHYALRARYLAAIYAALFLSSLAGLALLCWNVKLYVTLAERTNVETLVLLLGLAMFLLLSAMSAPGARGALQALRARLAARRGGVEARERAKARFCERRGRREGPVLVVLNAVIETPPDGASFSLADSAGDLGRIVVDGAVIRHENAFPAGSNSLLAFFVEQVAAAAARRGESPWLDIVAWSLLDGEDAARYASLVAFARALEAKLGAPLWPRVSLTNDDVRFIAGRLAEAVPSARLEAMLPDWEYGGEHKLPVIPEPLAFLTLSRSEARVDPASSMTMMLAVVLVSLACLAAFAAFPPWVPAR